MIESPFDPNQLNEDAILSIQATTKLAGLDDFFYIGVKHVNENVKVYTASSIASQGLVEHLRAVADEIEESLEDGE